MASKVVPNTLSYHISQDLMTLIEISFSYFTGMKRIEVCPDFMI